MELEIEIGRVETFSKTVSESDVYGFAGITGDFARNHVDEAFMAKTGFGRRIAHGALLVGYMSTCSTMMANSPGTDGWVALALGLDRIRFLAPVYFGDTVTVSYTLVSLDRARSRTEGSIEIRNQHDALVAVATHLIKWVPA